MPAASNLEQNPAGLDHRPIHLAKALTLQVLSTILSLRHLAVRGDNLCNYVHVPGGVWLKCTDSCRLSLHIHGYPQAS